MNAVDASEHYEEAADLKLTPSHLSIIIDTNPRAWAALRSELPLPKALANIIVFVNAHLALSSSNQVSIIASHVNRAVWLYPPPLRNSAAASQSEDVDMPDADAPTHAVGSANKYPPFAQVETSILRSLRALINDTTETDLSTTTTQMAGALTMVLCHINKTELSLISPNKAVDSNAAAAVAAQSNSSKATAPLALHARILVLSVSDSSPAQYIATMNAVFAAAHSRVAIDALALRGANTFLQQASFATGGTYLRVPSSSSAAATADDAPGPQGLLTYLLFGLLADATARSALIAPTPDRVDFRAACFCHRRVVDTGFVCSVCLSIFCEVPPGGECLTCGTLLTLGNYGAKPAVLPRRRKKRRARGSTAAAILNGEGMDTGSAAGTPMPID